MYFRSHFDMNMNLLEKSLEVREVFQELDLEISEYVNKSGLNCFAGCGHCCMNPKISATVIEFLPLAFDIYQDGNAEEVMDKLEITSEEENCMIFKKSGLSVDSGHCGNYIHRGLICRLFGMSVRKDKYGQKQMVICKKIKEGKPDLFLQTTEKINDGMKIPQANEFYAKLSNIDYRLTDEEFPINTAIKKALEMVMTYNYYVENQQ